MIFCIKCEFFKYGYLDSIAYCNHSSNVKASWEKPDGEQIEHPSQKNRNNNCKYFVLTTWREPPDLETKNIG